MINIVRKALVILFLMLFMLNTYAQEEPTGEGLTVTITGIESNKGEMLVSVFDAEESFLEDPVEHHQLTIEEGASELQFTIAGMEPGTYAVSVIHDKNMNGKLDMGYFGPKEPYGFSNDAKGFMGPPDYEHCTVAYDGIKLQLKIKLR